MMGQKAAPSPVSRFRPVHVLRTAATLALVAFSAAHATIFTWDGGGGNNNWSTANNWNPNGAPAQNAGADLVFAGATRVTNTADGTNPSSWLINSLSFASGASSFTVSNGVG